MKQFGYFDDPCQTVPAYDPGLSVDCPVCLNKLSAPIMTISIMLDSPRDSRSYFYRVHKSCYDYLGDENKIALDSIIIDAVAAAKNVN